MNHRKIVVTLCNLSSFRFSNYHVCRSDKAEAMGRPLHWEDRPTVGSQPLLQTFVADLKPRMHAFNQSLTYDQRMHVQDIKGSVAYAKSLALSGILTKDEESRIIQGLQEVGQEWENGTVSLNFLRLILKTREILMSSSVCGEGG